MSPRFTYDLVPSRGQAGYRHQTLQQLLEESLTLVFIMHSAACYGCLNTLGDSEFL